MQITKHALTKIKTQDILIQLAIGRNIILQTVPCIWYCVIDRFIPYECYYFTIKLDSFIYHKGDQADHKEGSSKDRTE